MPSLTGQFWVDAEPLLRSLGWTGMLQKLPGAVDSGYPHNSVVTQVPPPGQRITTGTTIEISFAA